MILEIPIRNWNIIISNISLPHYQHIRNTYKELKPTKISETINSVVNILEIPIRNWNIKRLQDSEKLKIDIRNTYKELKQK